MKRKQLSLLCVAAVLLAASPRALADAGEEEVKVIADVVVARPLCFAATIVGSAIFVVCLPFSSLTHSTHKSAHVFVVRPAKATFTRPIGDLDALKD